MDVLSVHLGTIINLLLLSVSAITLYGLLAKGWLKRIFVFEIILGVATTVLVLGSGINSALLLGEISAHAGGFFNLPLIWLPFAAAAMPIFLFLAIPGKKSMRDIILVIDLPACLLAYFLTYCLVKILE